MVLKWQEVSSIKKEEFHCTHLRADIDYAISEANTIYGKIGIKVWIFKGEVFGKRDLSPNVGQASNSNAPGGQGGAPNRRRRENRRRK